MGVLDKLMFWKKDTVELEYEVDGCFTLPMDGAEVQEVPGLDTLADGVVPERATTPDDPTAEQC